MWNRQRKEEMPIDVEEVALGHETKLKWNPESTWVFSDKQVHEPLVSKQTFDAVRQCMATPWAALHRAAGRAHPARVRVQEPRDPQVLRAPYAR